MTPERTVGLVGLSMFSLICIHCAVQIYKFKFISSVQIFKIDLNGNRIYENIKLRFHMIFGMNALFECVSAISQCLNVEYSRWGYICHLLGLYMNLIAYLMVIFMWNHVLACQNLIQVNWKFYILFLSINGLSTIVEVAIFAYYGDVDEYTTVQILDGFAANILYVVSLFVTTLLLLVIANKMKNKLKPQESNSLTSRSSGGNNPQSIRRLLHKINICLIIFLCSYSLRIYFISRFTVTWMLTGHEPEFAQYSMFMWALMTYWIPTLAPGLIFLYIMRFRPPRSKMEESLVSAPPSEQVYNYDLEDNITSPPTTTKGGEEDEEEDGGDGFEEGGQGPSHWRLGSVASGSREREGRGGDSMDISALEEEQEEDRYADRMTFYSKDGNDLKMSNIISQSYS